MPMKERGRLPRALSPTVGGRIMDREDQEPEGEEDEVPLVPAAAIGFLLYPWAIQLILAVPPANDLGTPRVR